MKTKGIEFVEPGKVTFGPVELPGDPGPGQVVIRSEATVLSAGTELAILKGTEVWAPLPFIPGYGGVGRVMANGSDTCHLKEGQLVFTHSRHALECVSDIMAVPVPENIPAVQAVMARMAQISMTAQRISDSTLGDHVAVLGLGLVGNLAAQLFSLAGCEVIGMDLSEKRLALARECGIAHAVRAGGDAPGQVKEITAGKMCRTVVEATGVPSVAYSAAEYAGPLGEVILLGSPRGEHKADLTPYLNRTHLWGSGCITVKGGHEWRLPVRSDPEGRVRHSFESSLDCIFRLIANGKLKVRELVSHVASPKDCAAMYRGVRENKEEYSGVVFDWTRIS